MRKPSKVKSLAYGAVTCGYITIAVFGFITSQPWWFSAIFVVGAIVYAAMTTIVVADYAWKSQDYQARNARRAREHDEFLKLAAERRNGGQS